MQITRQQFLLGLFLLITVCSLAGILNSGSGLQMDHKIRVSLLGTSDDEDYDGALAFKRYVETKSDYAIEVELYPSGQFCSTERECLEALQAGVNRCPQEVRI